MAGDVVVHREGHPRARAQELLRERRTFLDAFEDLPRPAACSHDVALRVEHDDDLAAFLDEHPAAFCLDEQARRWRAVLSGPADEALHTVASMAKVLIVEDDEVIAEGMLRHLSAAGFDSTCVGKGEAGLARLRYERPDVCVLDLMLPGVDGWRLIETVRREGIGTPIVVVSARGTEHDRVHALEIGADDYLVKPFSMKELVARVRAAARRGVRDQEESRGEPIQIEGLLIDPKNVQAYVGDQSCELTPTEFRLLYALAMEQGRVVTRDELLQRVWGRRPTHRDRTVDVFVRRLRDKLGRRSPTQTYIQTRYGVGYKLEAETHS